MVKIRLKRFGKRLKPFYRIVVIQSRTRRQGRSLEDLGSYDPIKKVTVIDNDKVKIWLEKGAQPTDTVKNIFIKNKILKADKFVKKFNYKPGKKSQERAEAKSNKTETKEVKAE